MSSRWHIGPAAGTNTQRWGWFTCNCCAQYFFLLRWKVVKIILSFLLFIVQSFLFRNGLFRHWLFWWVPRNSSVLLNLSSGLFRNLKYCRPEPWASASSVVVSKWVLLFDASKVVTTLTFDWQNGLSTTSSQRKTTDHPSVRFRSAMCWF